MMLYAPEDVIVRFRVDGEPVSKARARFTSYGSKTRTYNPAKTKEGEAAIAWAFLLAAKGHKVDAEATYGVAAEFHYSKRQRRDVDNMLKLICDALNGVCWADDNQVTEVFGRKSLAGVPGTEVVIYRTAGPEPRTQPCELCGEAIVVFPSTAKRRFCSTKCAGEAKRSKPHEPRFCANCAEPIEKRHNSTFCSKECRVDMHRVTQPCAQCGGLVERVMSWTNNGYPFCGSECRVTYWREHRAAAAKGVCADCGGGTTKKTYTRCRACFTAKRSA